MNITDIWRLLDYAKVHKFVCYYLWENLKFIYRRETILTNLVCLKYGFALLMINYAYCCSDPQLAILANRGLGRGRAVGRTVYKTADAGLPKTAIEPP